MLTEREEALNDLKEQLDRIKENNRQQIHLITLMADDYSQYAEDVAKLIVNHIKAAPSELKLVGIYVMDSIIKFSGDTVDKYRRLFGNEIVKLFVDAFEKAPIAHRQSLFKVRATWQEFFLKSKLFDLDNEVQKIDKSWPIFKQTTPRLPAIAATSSKSTAIPVASKPTVTPAAASTSATVTTPAAVTTTASTTKKAVKQVTPPQQAAVKARDPRLQSDVSVKKPILKQSTGVSNVLSSKSTAISSATKHFASAPPCAVKSSKTIIKKEIPSPPPVKNALKSQTPSPKKLSKKAPPAVKPATVTVKTEIDAPPLIKNVGTVKSVSNPQVLPPRKTLKRTPTSSVDTTTIVTKTTKTVATAKHSDTVVTRQRVVPEKKRRIEESHPVQPTAALGAHAFLPPPLIANPPPSVAFPMPPQPSISPLGAMLPVQIPKTEVIEDSWRSPAATLPSQVYNQPPPVIINSGPPPMHSSYGMGTSSIITNETPRHGSASNNRIFVDGRAYEVFYLNNEAVIEQNGLPHRIFFSGPPRDILIDGKPFKLAFDEIRMIHIDGVPHPVRFGAPSRELYIGDHPFRGAFGGPPMVANINGRRHEFRLCGPPPEVRIDQDPCYELSRHMNAVRGPQNVKPKQEEKLGKQDVIALLQKIKQHGILNKPLTISKDDSKTTLIAQKPSPPGPRIDVGTAREISAPPSLKDFQIGALMIRYSDVVEALHRPRTACPHCGIGFNDTSSEAYQRHIDIHVQDLLRTKETGKSRSRTWFIGKENWLEFDELAEVQKQPTTELQKGAIDDRSSPAVDKFAASPSDAIALTSLNKVCSVCHEKFNEYYDNDEEEWRFQDCVVKGNVAIHRYCVEQMEDGNDNNGNFGIKQEITQKQTAFPV